MVRPPPKFIRVFLIEDNASDERLITGMLKECGGGQLLIRGVAHRLSDAIRTLQVEEGVDVVLMDLSLPDSQGIDTFRNLAQALPALPIIVLSGYDDEQLAVMTVHNGAQDYLVKYELTGKLLVRSINYAIERKQGELALKAARQDLEGRIQERTQALIDANERLSDALNQLGEAQGLIIQQERMNAMERMSCGIAHDFNNALSPILAHSELLLIKPGALSDEEGVKNAVTKIHQSAEHCAEIVLRLCQFCRVNTDVGQLEPLDLKEIVQEAVDLTRPFWRDQAQKRGCNISMETHFSSVPKITGVRQDLREMFVDLLLNAADAIVKEGVISASVSLDKGAVTVCIADNGGGMSEEVAAHCLDPFFTTKKDKGVGLGLSVVYGIARRHGAEIDIESQEGEGTKAVVKIPVSQKTPEEAASIPAHTPQASLPERVTGLRILAVEDEPNIREILAVYLAEDGHHVELASDGPEALAKLTKGRFDLLLTDYSMPKMNGDRLAASVRATDPAVRIAMLTGFGSQLPQRAPLRLDVDAIIAKPFTFESLRRGIAEAMEGPR